MMDRRRSRSDPWNNEVNWKIQRRLSQTFDPQISPSFDACVNFHLILRRCGTGLSRRNCL